ncbi:mitochondrial inner membrane protein [Roseovarius sp. A-2]|uniref:mitofilin family membrane protein n=1 Tax=Roseovarius sp. A-2 TaxID=1570360 RepID=UPI0009CED710|nr:mitofilin family membrane protein [Roseovarius sp. A-2]GAW34604.1 mitochondrial inner membrane protein [Roseovarius sp. A-2]
MARKKTPETHKTEMQDKAAEDTPSPETELPPSEKPASDTAEDTPEAETPEPPFDADGAQETPDSEEEPREPETAPGSETVSGSESADSTDEAATDDATPEQATADERMTLAEDDDPMAEVATVAEAEEAQTGQQTGEAETSAPTPVTKTEQVTIRQGGFWSMLLGGVVAAGIGVIAAPYVLPDHPLRPVEDSVDTDALQDRIAAQETALGDLRSTVEGIEPASEAAPDLSGELGELRDTLTDLAEQVSSIESRVSELEDRPTPEAGGSDGTAEQIEELSAALSAQRAEIDALKGEAEAEKAAARDSARATLQRAALTRVMTALDSGDEFTVALADLRDTGAEVPSALSDVAESGVPTRAELTERFPEAARAALAAVRSADGGAASSVGGFFKSQLGIRSLEPREGDDPDAVLSRVEAALRDGRLGDALAEIETLPEGARAELSDWAAEAERRRAALSAANTLSGTLN